MNASSGAPQFEGWVTTDNDRGSLDILKKCAITLVLCTWSVAYVNVPALSEKRWLSMRRKAYMCVIMLLMPEIAAARSCCLWLSARRSVQAFRDSGFEGWTMRHAFYADMGGFVLETDDFPSVPVNAQQIFYLVKRGLIDKPTMLEDEIRDKSKVDGLLMLITFAQVILFAADLIGRAVSGLPVSCLETSTAAYLPILATCYWMLRQRPVDVSHPVLLRTSTRMSDMVLSPPKGTIARSIPYFNSPLDFVDRQEHHYSLLWAHFCGTLRKFGFGGFGQAQRPITRLREDHFWCPLSGPQTLLVHASAILLIFFYEGMLLAQWNAQFSSHTEVLIWRSMVIINFAAIMIWECWNLFSCNHHPALKKCWDMERGYEGEGLAEAKTTAHISFVETSHRTRVAKTPTNRKSFRENTMISRLLNHRLWNKIRNNSSSKDALLAVPLRWILPSYFMAFIYITSRLAIWAMDFAQFRSMPSNMFMTVGWEGLVLGG